MLSSGNESCPVLEQVKTLGPASLPQKSKKKKKISVSTPEFICLANIYETLSHRKCILIYKISCFISYQVIDTFSSEKQHMDLDSLSFKERVIGSSPCHSIYTVCNPTVLQLKLGSTTICDGWHCKMNIETIKMGKQHDQKVIDWEPQQSPYTIITITCMIQLSVCSE